MGDNHHRHALPAAHDLEELEDSLASAVVQRAGGLVAQEELRILRQGPGDGHPLLLSAGELGGEVGQPVLQAHGAQHLRRVQGLPADLGRQLHVLQGGEVGDQVVELEDKADVVAAVGGQLPGAVGGDLLLPQKDPPLAEGVHAPQDVQQRGLPRAAGPHDNAQLPFFHGEGGVPQGLYLHLSHVVDLFHPVKPDQMVYISVMNVLTFAEILLMRNLRKKSAEVVTWISIF